jgi:hypothetical protein
VKRWSAWGGGSGIRIVTVEDMRRRYVGFLERQKESAADQPQSEETEEEEAA